LTDRPLIRPLAAVIGVKRYSLFKSLSVSIDPLDEPKDLSESRRTKSITRLMVREKIFGWMKKIFSLL